MVVHEGEYQAQKMKHQCLLCHVVAARIAKKILGHFGLETKEKYFGFMINQTVDPMFRGVEISVYGLLEEFRHL